MFAYHHAERQCIVVIKYGLHPEYIGFLVAVADDLFRFSQVPPAVSAVALKNGLELKIGDVSELLVEGW